MTKRLITYVHVDGIPYGPDDTVPPAVARRIGAHAWTDRPRPEATDGQDDGSGRQESPPAPAGQGGGEGQAPPRTGKGATKEAWQQFAQDQDVEVAADASRDDIIAACEAAGVLDPDPPKE
ncbi:hypothetical protein [Streptomyces sp. NRRL F-5135]|uniref:hypothetical protein n=1 Tax=Streptomyces sp. NRRL F-5135 TaxID=1463858 RepID=UPI0004CBBBFE|nr:hypothetical protein [Streptomyces sp. NRRL F-5135]